VFEYAAAVRTVGILLLLASLCFAGPVVLRGARILTVTKGVIENGTLIA